METRFLELPIEATETLWDEGKEQLFAWLSFEARALSQPVASDSPSGGPLGSLMLLEPEPEPPISGLEMIRLDDYAQRRHLLWGWQGPEPGYRWAGGGRRSAWLVELDGARRYRLSTRLAASIPDQSVNVSLDGTALGRFAPVPGSDLDVSLELPRVLTGPHVIELRHARLATPRAILGSDDTRELTCLYRHFTVAEVGADGTGG